MKSLRQARNRQQWLSSRRTTLSSSGSWDVRAHRLSTRACRTSPLGYIPNKSSQFAKFLTHLLLFVYMRLLCTCGSWLEEQKLDQPAAVYSEMLATGRVGCGQRLAALWSKLGAGTACPACRSCVLKNAEKRCFGAGRGGDVNTLNTNRPIDAELASLWG